MQQGKPLLFGGSLSSLEFSQTVIHENVIGALCFTANDDSFQQLKAQTTVPCLHVPMQNLGGDEAVCEWWRGLGNLQQDTVGDIQFQYDDDVLFGVIQLSESAYQAIEHKTPLQQVTESAYRQIFSLIEQLQYLHIFRFWNYIADINIDSYQLERYRQFNMGRHDAFLAHQRDVVGNVPVACALGFNQVEQAKLSIAFLAGRTQPIPIENPRQMSAYQYPKDYGPVSPTFSRASLVKLKQSELLLISGTASIVGHATQHTLDAAIQAREAMTNIEAILDQANIIASEILTLADLHYRVYVRHPAHLSEIHDELVRYIGQSPKIDYFRADICRQDLLLEIEASVENPYSSSTVMKDCG